MYRVVQKRGHSAFSRISRKLPQIIAIFFAKGQCILNMSIMCEFAHFITSKWRHLVISYHLIMQY